jgi:hypothetical protein
MHLIKGLKMKCWKCGFETADPPLGKLSFRALCDQCSAWLHCCKNCKNYKPGLPNDCMVPGTEYIPDREACNFCEDFQLLGIGPKQFSDPKKASKKLFKNEDDQQPRPKGFNSLFIDREGQH